MLLVLFDNFIIGILFEYSISSIDWVHTILCDDFFQQFRAIKAITFLGTLLDTCLKGRWWAGWAKANASLEATTWASWFWTWAWPSAIG